MSIAAEIAMLAHKMLRLAAMSGKPVKIVGRGSQILAITDFEEIKDDILLGRYKAETIEGGLTSNQWNDLTQRIVVYRRLRT